MGKILLISDIPIGASNRGAEQCDKIIYDGLECDFQTCQEFNEQPRLADSYIVSNFASLNYDSQGILMARGNYTHIAHDFLFVPSRDPSLYPDYKVYDEHFINVEFLKAAKTIFCQSNFQASIFKVNGFHNVESWGGNLWSEENLAFLLSLANNPKKARAAVIDHAYKGTEESMELCRKLNIPFDNIGPMDYYSFLSLLSTYSVYAFVPEIPETFCRVLIEAKIIGTVPITDWRCGAVHEECYKLEGAELAEYMNGKREEILNKLK